MSILLTQRAEQYGERTAIVAPEGSFTYPQLLDASGKAASFLLDGPIDLQQRPVAFLAPPGFHYVALQWGIWRAGGIAVPLSLFHPRPELEYVLDDTTPAAALAHPDFVNRLHPLARERNLRFASSTEALDHAAGPLPPVTQSQRAMILYTSGTTGKPKGVVTTHENIAAQITSLVEAWGWTGQDRISGIFASASCPRNCKRHRLRPLGGGSVRDPARIRRAQSLGANRSGRSYALHGSPHHLCKTH